MKSKMGLAAAGACALLLQGCANWQAVFKDFNVAPGDKGTKSVTVDVKQRAILSNTIRDKNGNDQVVICAEPSPDALSVLASGLSGSANAGDKKVIEMAFSQTETASFIGNRTVTIQLLRDNLYRACEGYMSGAWTKDEYLSLVRRYQVMTMGLLAIEHLTETVKPGAVTITAGGAAASRGASEADVQQAAAEKADAVARHAASQDKHDKAKADLTAAEEAVSQNDPDEETAKAARDKAQKALDSALKQLRVDKSLMDTAAERYDEIKGGTGLMARVTGGSVPSGSGATNGTAQGTKAIADVAVVVQKIVENTIQEGFRLDKCLTLADGSCLNDAQKERAVKAAQEICGNYKDPKTEADAWSKCMADIGSVVDMSMADIRDVLQIMAARTNDVKIPSKAGDEKSGGGGANEVDLPSLASVEIANKAFTGRDSRPPSKSFRLDVFTTGTAKDEALITQAQAAGLADQFSTVRLRRTDADNCAKYFNIRNPVTIRYDQTQTEVQVKDFLLGFIKQQLKVTAVAEPVRTPTPLYISVFLCNP